jgi:hypothetical protein
MPAESGSYVSDLDKRRPTIDEPISEGDDHIRLIKEVLTLTFPEASGPQAPVVFPVEANSIIRSDGTVDANGNMHWVESSKTTIDQDGHIECESVLTRGDVSAMSDDRLKNRYADIDDALDKIKSLDAFMYVPNEQGMECGMPNVAQAGVSAQQVQSVFPVAVRESDNQYLAVDYSRLCVLLLAAVKELAHKVESQP